MAAVAAKAEELKNLGVEVLAISIDSPFVHKVWNETELSKLIDGGFPFVMVSDGAGKIGQLYGVYDQEAMVNLRGTFLIDPDGVIQTMEIHNAPIGRNFNELVRRVQAAQHVRNSGGTEAAPANWEPGKPTLKPDIKIAGKVYEVYKS